MQRKTLAHCFYAADASCAPTRTQTSDAVSIVALRQLSSLRHDGWFI